MKKLMIIFLVILFLFQINILADDEKEISFLDLDKSEYKNIDYKKLFLVGNHDVKLYKKMVNYEVPAKAKVRLKEEYGDEVVFIDSKNSSVDRYIETDLQIGTVLKIIKKCSVPKKEDEDFISDFYDKKISLKKALGLTFFKTPKLKKGGKSDLEFYNYNSWFKVKYNGKTGYVFGSFRKKYLRSLEKILKWSYFYKNPVYTPDFLDFAGPYNLSNKMQNKLKRNKLLFERMESNKFSKSYDDMFDAYDNLPGYNKTLSIFITTDLYLHTLHLLFDNVLKKVEQDHFYPVLQEFIKKSYKRLKDLKRNIATNNLDSDSIDRALSYFIVAGNLMDLKLTDKSKYPVSAINELKKIKNKKKMADNIIYGEKEDYTQYKVRGHYDESEKLKKYFKTMMWFGRTSIRGSSQKETDNRIEVFSYLYKKNEDLYKLWLKLFEPITYVVGEPDNTSLSDLMAGKKRISRISDTSLTMSDWDKITEEGTINSFRLFPQRFSFDSYIYHKLSSPRIGTRENLRTMVSGKDVMGLFGNEYAKNWIKEEIKQYAGGIENYKELKKGLDGFSEKRWRKNFYYSYLKLLKILTSYNPDKFFFTGTEGWIKKSLLTSSAGYADLKHATILYTKQAYSEMAGGGYNDYKTYEVIDIKNRINYIEPNLEFFTWLDKMLVDLKNILQNQGFLDIKIRSKILDFKDILENTIEIVRIENNDKPISREQNEYIRKLINKISVVPYFENVGSMSRRTAESDLRMALVADVFTDSAGRKVLEQAVGKPYRFYVPLYDNHGGKRIAVGYTYSYYEFKQPMNNRLNDKQWKKKVYSDDINSLNEYIPNWMTDLILFKNGNSKNKDTVKKSDTTSESKLIIAVKENNVKLVKKLLKDGADINKKNSSGNTALIEASKTGNKSIVMTLLVNGADKKIENNEGKTAYDIAKENGHSNIIKFLD